jgi:hypothetical protein
VFSGLDLLDEFADREVHIDDPDRKALFAQQVRVALRVGPRLPQGVDVLIPVVADGEREPIFSERGPAKQSQANSTAIQSRTNGSRLRAED